MPEPFFAVEVIEAALQELEMYDPFEDTDVVADAQAIVDALHAAGFKIMRTASKGS